MTPRQDGAGAAQNTMSFEPVIDAAIELLRRRRRVTYRVLQREFGLDDEALADLKDELILAQRLARDDGGQVLVWAGEADGAGGTPAAGAGVRDSGERRQLTVMFCDLVGSTRLSNRLDPEDLRDIVRAYHAECAAVLRPSGGHIAQYLGDGLLVYFGWPRANEDDAERAVLAGLAIVRAVGQLGQRHATQLPEGLCVRVGIHTGLVVVGGHGDDPEAALALGEAPNIAAHIQAVAGPDTVMISQATQALLPPRFDIEALGPVVLKDTQHPVRLARVRGEIDAAAARSSLAARGPLVDAGGHLPPLREAWTQVQAGATRLVLLAGEAGLGKTRLVDEVCGEAHADGAGVHVLSCSAFHRASALHPVAQYLLRRAGLNPDAPGEAALGRLEALLAEDGLDPAGSTPLLQALLGGETDGSLPPAQLMQALQALLADWLRACGREQPAVMVWEDVHWADPTTLSVMRRLLATPATRGLLVLATTRPEGEPDLPTSAPVLRLPLQRMGAAAVRQIVLQVAAGRRLAPSMVEHIVKLAEGVPLYAEQITASVLDAPPGSPTPEVPATLHASLMSRLDRMGPAKSVAQTAALLGREFSGALLHAVCGLPEPDMARSLQQLVQGDVLAPIAGVSPPRFAFRHALLQAAAGESMLRSARQLTHGRIARVLRERFPEALEGEPETLARHLTEAGEVPRAVAQWQRAGERALGRSAVAEAVLHLKAGLELLPQLRTGQARDAAELALQVLLASALRAAQGVAAPATGAAYERAAALARALGNRERLIPALNGLYSYHLVSGRCDLALAPAQELLDTARAHGDALFEMIGHRAVGAVAFHVGDPRLAREHLEAGLAQYEPARHAPMAVLLGIDHRVAASNFLALTLAVLGEDEAAVAVQRAGLAWAEQLEHAHSLAQALVFHCLLLAVLERWDDIGPLAARARELGQRRGFPLMESAGRFFGALPAAFGGDAAGALPTLAQGANDWWATGAQNYRPLVEMLLARTHAQLGHDDEVTRLLEHAAEGITTSGETWLEPELWRIRARLLPGLRADALARAETLAREQGALGLLERVRRDAAQRALA
jgi:class 3 adenylate cyclase/predicted ATPase